MPKPAADAIILGISLRNYVDYYIIQNAFCQGKMRIFLQKFTFVSIFLRAMSEKRIDI